MTLLSLAEVFLFSLFFFIYHTQPKYFTKIMPQYFHYIHAVSLIWYNDSSIEITYHIFMQRHVSHGPNVDHVRRS